MIVAIVLFCIVASLFISIAIEFSISLVLDDYGSDARFISIALVLSLISIVCAFNIYDPSKDDIQTVGERYDELLLKEEFELYKAASKDDIAKFKEAYIDKCVKLSSEQKANALNSFMDASFKFLKSQHKNNNKAGYCVKTSIVSDESLKSEFYSAFLKNAPKFTEFRFLNEGDDVCKLVFSFESEMPDGYTFETANGRYNGKICKCKKVIKNTSEIE